LVERGEGWRQVADWGENLARGVSAVEFSTLAREVPHDIWNEVSTLIPQADAPTSPRVLRPPSRP
jgi:hypothetical protein